MSHLPTPRHNFNRSTILTLEFMLGVFTTLSHAPRKIIRYLSLRCCYYNLGNLKEKNQSYFRRKSATYKLCSIKPISNKTNTIVFRLRWGRMLNAYIHVALVTELLQ